MDEITKKKIENECEKSKTYETCEEFLRKVPKDQLKVEPRLKEESLEVKTKKKMKSIKGWLQEFSEPPKEERHKDIFKYCTTHEPPCNLECLYGRRQIEDEELDDIVKERIYTKQGAVYDTISYRLPLDFGVGPVPVTKEEKLAAETAAQLVKEPWYDDKTKKKKKKKKKPEMLEFSGPVKILIVDKEGFFTCYTAKRIHAAFIQLSYMFIGATILLMYFYTIQFKTHYSTNLHIICCTIAFQFCLPAALLVRNKECVAGYLMSTKHTFQHSVILKTIAIINIVGCAFVLSEWKPVLPVLYTSHALAGYAACSFALAEYILHLLVACVLGHDRGFIVDCYLHILIIAAIATAFISFALAIIKHPPLKYFINYTHWYYWTLAMTGVFILTATFRTLMDCSFHIWKYLYAVGMWMFHLVRPHDPCTIRIKDVENPFNLINKTADQKTIDPKKRDKKKADVKKADVKKTDIIKADVKKTDVKKADVKKADVKKTDVKKTDIIKADVKKTDIIKADVKKTDVKKADVKKTGIIKVNLKKTDKKKTNQTADQNQLQGGKCPYVSPRN